MFDVAVIGAGIMGSSAARHVAERGLSTVILAAPEPESSLQHQGPFGAHYDVSRITSFVHVDPVEAELAARAKSAMPGIEAEAPGPSHTQSGHLTVLLDEADPRLVAASAAGLEILDDLSAGLPQYSFPSNALAYLEPAPAGRFDPRAMISTQLEAALSAGATLLPFAASKIESGREVLIRLTTGAVVAASRVLVAVGAYANKPGLLPRRLALRLKTESVVLALVDAAAAVEHERSPTIVYDISGPSVGNVYSVPPVRYPDGRFLMKLGANTSEDRWLDVDAVNDWYRSGSSMAAQRLLRSSVEAVYRDTAIRGVEPHRCVVTYTTHGRPYIDEVVPGSIYVAIGGNGKAAKWSDPLGRLAADLVATGEWADSLDRQEFSACYEGEQAWEGAELMAGR